MRAAAHDLGRGAVGPTTACPADPEPRDSAHLVHSCSQQNVFSSLSHIKAVTSQQLSPRKGNKDVVRSSEDVGPGCRTDCGVFSPGPWRQGGPPCQRGGLFPVCLPWVCPWPSLQDALRPGFRASATVLGTPRLPQRLTQQSCPLKELQPHKDTLAVSRLSPQPHPHLLKSLWQRSPGRTHGQQWPT